MVAAPHRQASRITAKIDCAFANCPKKQNVSCLRVINKVSNVAMRQPAELPAGENAWVPYINMRR